MPIGRGQTWLQRKSRLVHPARGLTVLTMIAILGVAPNALVACGRTGCGDLSFDGTVVGRLTQARGNTATFTPVSTPDAGGSEPKASTPSVGKPLAVRYPNADIRFLQIGTMYRVEIVWDGTGFVSSVDAPCSASTRYPDSSPVRASHTSWLRRNRLALAAGLVPFAALLAVSAFAWSRRRPRSRSCSRRGDGSRPRAR